MKCNICGSRDFVDMGNRLRVRCQSCGSLERTRLLYLFFESLGLSGNLRILHIAPEKGLYHKIKSLPGIEYVAADIEPARFTFADDCQYIDLTKMEEWPSDHFDLILHSHVIEHIPCSLAYPMFHLHRILKKDGVHLCIIPFMGGKYDETFAEIGDQERTRRFGQHDHVRRLGRDDLSSHLGAIVNLPDSFDATSNFTPEQLLEANIPENHWRGFHIGTVLMLKKSDYRLTF